jgi:hypothetical protein
MYKIGLNVKNVKFGEKQSALSNKHNIFIVRMLKDTVMKNKNKKKKNNT